jgi:hypothetical protein
MPSSRWLAQLRRRLPATRSGVTRQPPLRVEDLEARDVPAVFTPDYAIAGHANTATPFGTTGPTGLSPTAIRQAYGFNQVSFGGTAGTGAGTTIAIVDAYDDPTISSDLHAFDQQYGLADPTFTKVNQTGGTALPAANAGWAGEISLDVEWAHAIAPAAKILLVEASSASDSDLFAAVGYAARQPGVVAVSMSFGGGEYGGETAYDSTFLTPAGHTGVVFVASSGDSGAPISYPAASPNVLSVGGTTLNLTASGAYGSETGWSGSGGGVSAYESRPSYQNGVVTQSTTKRTAPDVSYDADPNTGFSVYQTYGNSSTAPWVQYGGTSDAAPQWAALIAIADQGRAAAGEAALSSTTLLPMIYQLPSSDFHDVTSGTSSGSPNYSASAGYDLVTGRGTPVANLVIAGLVGGTTTSPPPAPTATHFAVTGPATDTAGTSVTVTVTAESAANATVTGYAGTVSFGSSDALAGLPSSYTFTASDHGVHTFTVTLKTAGSDTVTVSAGTLTGSETVAVTPAAATHLTFTQQPASGTVGAGFTVVVTELDAYGNVVTQDNSTQLRLALGSNAAGATLTGGGPVTVVHGVATFTGVSLNKAGTGYTLVASGGTLTAATSAAFAETAASAASGTARPGASITAAAAHDGSLGFSDPGDGDWYLRLDSAAQVNPGDTVSVWTQFAGTANGASAFGFGTTQNGTLSAVLSAATGQLLIQSNAGFGAGTTLASVGQSYQANQWYLVKVQWGTSGTVTVQLFAANGTTLLNSVTAVTHDTTPGAFAFRATGSTKYFDTVTVTRAVNSFAVPAVQLLAPAPAAKPSAIPVTTASTPARAPGDSIIGLFGPAVTAATHATAPATAPLVVHDSAAAEDWFGEFSKP